MKHRIVRIDLVNDRISFYRRDNNDHTLLYFRDFSAKKLSSASRLRLNALLAFGLQGKHPEFQLFCNDVYLGSGFNKTSIHVASLPKPHSIFSDKWSEDEFFRMLTEEREAEGE